MNIFGAIKKDHKKVEGLLDRLVSSSEQGTAEWKDLVTQIRDELIPHSRAEEALFYNPIRDTEHGKSAILHAYGEHAMAEADLRTLQAMKAIDANWTALAKKLQKDILHHVEEEAENIGEAFEALKPQIKEQSLAGTSYDLLLNLLPESLRSKLSEARAEAKKKSA